MGGRRTARWQVSGVLAGLLVLLSACGAPAAAPPVSPARSVPAAAPATEEPPTTVPTEPPATGSVRPCTGDGLDVSATPPRTDDGGTLSEIVFRNTGSAPCVLRGYPGVSFVAGNEGTPVGPRASVEGPRAEVRLEPGRAATSALRVRDTDRYPAAVCVPAEARGLRVHPPGGSGGTFVPRAGRVCSGEPHRPQVTVESVVAR
ncbi:MULTISPECIES: DUF4232 domain-containing protein [unclassified Pseudonocardia]|uniref:DUF4232 domain-containing protein n=1 Tax=unclassified Pseudonocardia TaxID=2619320 RepID=UPI0009F90BB0|nr:MULTISPECIES: DUF4232 domain-containing protein [unclassified Pseudonocardia]